MKNVHRYARFCIKLSVFSSFAWMLAACNEEKGNVSEQTIEEPVVNTALVSTEDRLSYLMGYSAARQISEAGLEMNADVVLAAIEDAKAGRDSKLSDEDAHRVGSEFQKLIHEKRSSTEKNKNIALGKAYMEENAKRDGVIQTASGIQYEVINGAKDSAQGITASDSVEVHYHGMTIDGQVFDSSVDRGSPVTFGVTQVIPGWTEILLLMKKGDKWRVVIPYTLAYPDGTRNIQPGETLVFEIEILNIVSE